MSGIPQPFVLDGGIDTFLGGGVDTRLSGGLDTHISGIPDHLTLSIDKMPKIEMGIDPLDLSIRIKELPSRRIHLPADFRVGLSLLGLELLTVRLCGQAMSVSEPYVPNPCELCGKEADHPHDAHRLVLGDE